MDINFQKTKEYVTINERVCEHWLSDSFNLFQFNLNEIIDRFVEKTSGLHEINYIQVKPCDLSADPLEKVKLEITVVVDPQFSGE